MAARNAKRLEGQRVRAMNKLIEKADRTIRMSGERDVVILSEADYAKVVELIGEVATSDGRVANAEMVQRTAWRVGDLKLALAAAKEARREAELQLRLKKMAQKTEQHTHVHVNFGVGGPGGNGRTLEDVRRDMTDGLNSRGVSAPAQAGELDEPD